MVGVLFKYEANPKDEWLNDKRDFDNCAGFSDPDFCTNSFPIWSICGPYVRQSLKKGDYVFFLPKKNCYEDAGYSNYLCTGVLQVVDFCDKEQVSEIPNIRSDYVENYLRNLEAHNKQDHGKKTYKIRRKKIVYGKLPESRWFGMNNLDLTQVFRRLNIQTIDLSARKIKYLTDTQSNQLYNFLMTNCRHEVKRD